MSVVEVDRPDRKTRRMHGKSDPIDAIAAARAVLAGTATGTPKLRMGPVEAIRALRVARRGAVKARVAALNQLHGLIASAPETLRAELMELTRTAMVRRCAGFRIDQSRLDEPEQATKAALRAIGDVSSPWTRRSPPRTARSAPPSPRLLPPRSDSPGSVPMSARSSSSSPATTPNDCAARPPSPICAAPHHYRPALDGLIATGSTATATRTPTTHCTPSSCAE